MKKAITLIVLIITCVTTQSLTALPWWSFLVPVFLLGTLLPLQKWNVPAFLFGCIAGFLVWLLSTLYFEAVYEGAVINRISKVFKMPPFLLYSSIGLIGAVLTGLAFYSGSLLRRGKQTYQLELPERLDSSNTR